MFSFQVSIWPGGGFQAGVIIAAAIILYALLEGERALTVRRADFYSALITAGALLYGLVGLCRTGIRW